MASEQDRKLVAACLAGDEDAWSSLYHRTHRTVYFITHWKRWNFSRDEADDVMQDVFANLITSLKTFNFQCSLETFASNIAKNNCVSHIRKITAEKRGGETESVSLDTPDEEGRPRFEFADKRYGPDRLIEREQAGLLVQAALDSLGVPCREIITLKYYENRSYEEIVSLLNLPMGTVASRLKRCLQELKKQLTRRNTGEAL